MKPSAFRPALPGWAAAAVVITGSLQLPACGDTEKDRGEVQQNQTEDAGGTDDASTADASDAGSDGESDADSVDSAIPADADGEDSSIVDPGICPV